VQPAALSPRRRTDDIARLSAQPLDVLVIGGGITGAGAALDAASRGLTVGLVEAQDFASGSSSRSSKLIHGGLRYLEMLDFGLIHQALKERGLLLGRLAPHLVQPIPILYPLRRHVVERMYVGAGIALYDLLAWSTGTSRGLPFHRHLSRRRALELAPGVRSDALVGAVQYHDAQVDDARFVIEVVRTAVTIGATAVNRMAVVGFLYDGSRVVGAKVRDVETGESHDIRARATVVATGAWTEETEALAGHQRAVRVRPSKGVHLLVSREKIASSIALILRTEASVLFVLPWHAHWLIGTTDTDWEQDKARPVASVADVDYLLARVNVALAEPLTRSDVEATFAGLRPLVAGVGVVRGPRKGGSGAIDQAGTKEPTTTLSREHAIGRPAPGLVVISGGKYTTYRVMAADAIDAALDDGAHRPIPSMTDRLPLLGAEGYLARWDQRERLASENGLLVADIEHLLHRYGSLIDEVLALVDADPTLGGRVDDTSPYLRAEVVYAVTHEGAHHLDDVLERRTRIAIESPNGGVDSAGAVAELIAPLLGWDEATRRAEVEDFRCQAALEQAAASSAQDDDEAARFVKETRLRCCRSLEPRPPAHLAQDRAGVDTRKE
jgi:glycerol-3-phosphate dehydrogenase